MKNNALIILKILSITLLTFSSFFISCESEKTSSPPYVIGPLHCSLGERKSYYLVAGLEFDFWNISQKDIVEIETSGVVFDRDTEANPFVGTNVISSVFSGRIPANTKHTLILPLDQYIYHVPVKPYIIDYFYIKKILYSDGSIWVDCSGAYYTRSE